jgi:hypothetical protein
MRSTEVTRYGCARETALRRREEHEKQMRHAAVYVRQIIENFQCVNGSHLFFTTVPRYSFARERRIAGRADVIGRPAGSELPRYRGIFLARNCSTQLVLQAGLRRVTAAVSVATVLFTTRQRPDLSIKGALLVAPADVDSARYTPSHTPGLRPDSAPSASVPQCPRGEHERPLRHARTRARVGHRVGCRLRQCRGGWTYQRRVGLRPLDRGRANGQLSTRPG